MKSYLNSLINDIKMIFDMSICLKAPLGANSFSQIHINIVRTDLDESTGPTPSVLF